MAISTFTEDDTRGEALTKLNSNLTDQAAIGLTGKMLWVDSVNGNDSTGTRGKSNLPFLSPVTAASASSSGDTIVIRPGTYNIGSGVFTPPEDGVVIAYGATLTGNRSFTGQGSGIVKPSSGSRVYGLRVETYVFNDSGTSPVGLKISNGGNAAADGAEFIDCIFYGGQDTVLIQDQLNTGAHTTKLIRCSISTAFDAVFSSGASTTIILDGCFVYGAAVDTVAHGTVSTSGGTIIATNSRFEISSDSAPRAISVLENSTATVMDCVFTIGGANANKACVESAGTTLLQNCIFNTSGTAAVAICSDGTTTISNGSSDGNGGMGVTISGGTLIIEGIRLSTSSNASSNPITKSGGTLILGAGTVLVAHASRDSITAGSAQNVKVYPGCCANKAVNGNITQQVSTLTVSADVQ